MTVKNGNYTESVTFDVMEKWTSIEVHGFMYYKDVKVKVLYSTTAAVVIQEYDSLREVFDAVCGALGLNVLPSTPPTMESTIINRHRLIALTAI